YATFFETMLARLTSIPTLRTRDLADPSIALLDAWAIVADVLTFYQERIANEGYLPTACERRSVLELARLIGYRLRPGVAASVRLAFTVMPGFQGTIPAGTRAQSIPNTGQNPQFFETSGPLDARDVWNALAPRLTRTQVITPEFGQNAATAVDVIDTVYIDGITTNVRPGDALLFVFGTRHDQQHLRVAESVDVQAAQQRTEVTLAFESRHASSALSLFLAKALYLFPGSDLAARVAEILNIVVANANLGIPPDVGIELLRGALAQLAVQQTIATARGFSRVAAFLRQLVSAMEALIVSGAPFAAFPQITATTLPSSTVFQPWPAETTSPLQRLDAIVKPLAIAQSQQPANALQLARSVAQTFAPASDVAPRMLAALNPAAAGALYQAWSAVATPTSRVQVFAARVRATLFAASFPGAATVTQGVPPSFSDPSISTMWTSLGTPTAPLSALALDTVYERITAGSWAAVDRLWIANGVADGTRVTTYHVVTDVRTTVMDTGAGFSAKVTLLTVEPPWLANTDTAALGLEEVLRTTIVYAQSEALTLVPEPLDTDVGGDSIDLANVYDGLQPGRWIIVSGTRTDIRNVSGVAASELAMVAGVTQGSQAASCVPFPFTSPPFDEVYYVTAADLNGDRLVVGRLSAVAMTMFADANWKTEQQRPVPFPTVINERYCDQVELGPGTYAAAYVPGVIERDGQFFSFDGLLVDPTTFVPFANGSIDRGQRAKGLFAWRIADDKLHTVLQLAAPLAYTYDRGTVTIYGNVIDATHGQSTGEVLGNGDATEPFATFALGQSPLTYVSAPTPSGTASTLAVRVNELLWHEVDDLGAAGPAQHAYATREDNAHKTAVTFGNGVYGARLPTGTANVKATYRYGLGKAGNLDAGQISQLATHPLGAQAVVNPLPSTGGADADSIEQARANAPIAVMALDRLVSVRDYADFARAYAGIGKAVAARLSDGRTQLVHVTIAGAEDIPIDPGSDLYRNLVRSLQTYGDPYQPIAVGVRRVRLIVMSAVVTLVPDYFWESVAPKIRDALLALFAFDARALGQTAFLSEAVSAAQAVEGVAYLNVTKFDGVAEDITAAKLAALGSNLTLSSYVQAEGARIDASVAPGSPGRILAAEVVFMTPDIPDTLILSEAGS
ncbi:MAG TPA: putative baseplate assembly protein, partial [Xanthomonadales bacterium]|nr:putative baseplate assembly protein [Xanthomonadales bacterium]